MPNFTLPLVADGAVVDILVGLCAPDVQRLRTALQPIPQPVAMRAVLDTGSLFTCVDSQAFTALGLSPTGTIRILTASTGAAAVDRDQYDVSLTIVHPGGNPAWNLEIGSWTTTDSPLQPTGIPALIGIDLLARCRFIYDGRGGMFTLEY